MKIFYCLRFLFCWMLVLPLCGFSQWTSQATGLYDRFEGQSALHDGSIYIFTGFKAGILIVPQTEAYDIASNTWSQKTSFPLSKFETDPVQAGVTHQGCTVVGDSIWFAGGRTGHHPGPITDEVWIYDVAANAYTPGPDLPLPLAAGGMVAIDRTLHIIGGFTNACNGDQDQYHLTLDIDAWRNSPSTVTWENNLAPLPRTRNHIGIATLKGKIYIFGGQIGHDCGGGLDLNWVDAYDLATDTWSILPNLPGTRSHSEPCTFVMDGEIYLGAGEPGATPANKVAIFDPVAQTWSEPTALNLPNPLLAPSMRPFKNRLYMTHGGINGFGSPSKNSYYYNLSRTPDYQLGFFSDTLKIQVYQGQTTASEALLWAVDGEANYQTTNSGLPAWLSYVGGTQTGTVDFSGAYVKLGVNAASLTTGNYYQTIQATGSGPDVINPANTVTHTSDQLVVAVQVLPAPNGVVSYQDLGPGCTPVELGSYVDKTIRIFTQGNTPVTFSSITSSQSPEFQILTNPIPAGIAGNSGTNIVVRFSPAQIGTRTTTITVVHSGTNSPYQFTLTCEGEPSCSPPASWSAADIGFPTIVGSTCYDGSTGTYTVNVGGIDIWGNSDQFHFVKLPVTGDGEIVARVTSIGNSDVWAKAGLMMRETTNAGSKNAMVTATSANGVRFQYRTNTDGTSSNSALAGSNAPVWLRLVRQANTFTGYYSYTGATGPWTVVGASTTISMSTAIQVGLAVTSHNSNVNTTGVIDQVSVSFAGTLPVELTDFEAVPVNGAVRLSWTTLSEVNASHFVVERSADGRLFEAMAQTPATGTSFIPVSYLSTDLLPLRGTSYYRLKMVDLDGTFSFSPMAEVSISEAGGFAIYPNPASSELTFQYLHSSPLASELQILDLNGKILYQTLWNAQPFGEWSYSVEQLPAGLYAYRILAGEQLVSGLFQVVKP